VSAVNPDTDEASYTAQNIARNRGWSVFPVAANKHPTTPRGFKDATADPAAIELLWAEYPGPFIGIATGAISGIDVLDLDVKHPEACAWWQRYADRMPATRTYRSRSGGGHFYLRHAEGLRCSNSRIAKGVDIKADEGCCTFRFAAGFECLDPSEPAEWPAWLLRAATPPPAPPPSSRRPAVLFDKRDEKAIRGALDVVSEASEGERNARLFWAACRLGERVRAGQLGHGEAETLLLEAARAAGLPPIEARPTIRSGLRRAA
jgi:hypothetical protein